DLRHRHKKVLPLLGAAVGHLREINVINEAFANEWLDTFLLARISTEMLTLHYTALTDCHARNRGGDTSSCTGIVDTRCDPGQICRLAVENLRDDPDCSRVAVHIESHACTSSLERIAFSFLPDVLLRLVTELLKNSAWATVCNRSAEDPSLKAFPIHIVIGANQRQVMIKISDRGAAHQAHALQHEQEEDVKEEEEEEEEEVEEEERCTSKQWQAELTIIRFNMMNDIGNPKRQLR
ncbi:unnamed protein product, partial [Polarella glacialis]